MMPFVIAYFVLLGFIMGSFGSVLVERLPAGRSIRGRSQCPGCHQTLRWIDLFPLMSYVFLNGRCSHCRKRIPLMYPLIELASGAIFLGAALLHSHDPISAITTAVVVWALLMIAMVDMRHKQIPDLLTMIIAGAGIASALHTNTLGSSIAGALVCIAWFGGQWLVSGGRWVGSGDILLGAALGLWLGGVTTVGFLLLSYIVGMVWIAVLLLAGKVRLKKGAQLAFAPMLAIAAIAAKLGMVDWYVTMLF